MAKPTRYGSQVPRYHTVPEFASTAGDDALELATYAGLTPFPWQELVVRESMGEKPDGTWAAMEVGLIVGRQNGKGDVIMIRELAGMYVLQEPLIIHSAHETKTAFEAFRRILTVIESNPELEKLVLRVSHSHGQEGIELKNGSRLRFLARSTGAGRGFSAQCLILDEAYALTTEQKAAIMPTMSAQPNPQIWYTSSAGLPNSIELGRIHKRGSRGDESLAFFGWSVDPDDYDPADPACHAEANPSYGYLIREDVVRMEQRSMDPDTFARERLGIGQYPDEEGGWEIVPEGRWSDCADPDARIEGAIAFGVDVTPDRSKATVSASGRTRDGNLCVEVIDAREGTSWLPERLAELREKWKPVGIFIDSRSPAASLDLTVEDLVSLGSADVAKACSSWEDESLAGSLRHRDDQRLNGAVAKAKKRPYGDGAWYLGRKDAKADLTPLTSSVLALFGIQDHKDQGSPWIW